MVVLELHRRTVEPRQSEKTLIVTILSELQFADFIVVIKVFNLYLFYL